MFLHESGFWPAIGLLIGVAAVLNSSIAVADEGPCMDDGWGAVEDPKGAVHVRTDGDDTTGTGTVVAPFHSLSRALDETRARDAEQRIVAIGPGVFPTSELLASPHDHGLQILGCGPEETVLDGEGADDPVLDFNLNGDFRLAGVSLRDARTPLTIRGNSVVDLRRVSVSDARGAGVFIDGFGTLVDSVKLTVGALGLRHLAVDGHAAPGSPAVRLTASGPPVVWSKSIV